MAHIASLSGLLGYQRAPEVGPSGCLGHGHQWRAWLTTASSNISAAPAATEPHAATAASFYVLSENVDDRYFAEFADSLESEGAVT